MEIKKPRHLYSQLTTPSKDDTEVMQREKERMRRILAGEQVETREESIRRLGLNRVWS